MAFLRAFGSYLPAKIVGNVEVSALCGCEPDWIKTASGIEQRRVAATEETVVEMGARAAEDCFKRAGVEASRIGLILFATGSAEQRFPGPAAEVAIRLGLPGIPAIDLPMASAGSLFGLALASQLAPMRRCGGACVDLYAAHLAPCLVTNCWLDARSTSG